LKSERIKLVKKILMACFVFLFLLAVVAGCPQKPSETKPRGGGSDVVDFNEGDSGSDAMVSSDEYTAK